MYQTSLKQFLGIFDQSMASSKKSPITGKRIQNIIEFLTFSTFKYTARGLYEADKFLFTILQTLKVEMNAGRIRNEEFQASSLDIICVKHIFDKDNMLKIIKSIIHAVTL